MLVETGKIFCLSLDTGKQSGTFRPLLIALKASLQYEIFYVTLDFLLD